MSLPSCLTLRTVKGSVLSWAELDNNFICLNNLISAKAGTGGNRWYIPSGETVSVTSDYQYFFYGDIFIEGTLDLASNSQLVVLNGNIYTGGTGTTTGSGSIYNIFLPTGDTKVTGLTYSGDVLTIYQNDGTSYSATVVTSTDITVTGGTYDPNTGVATFYNNVGGNFPVSGFLTGYTDVQVNDLSYVGNTLVLNQTNGTSFSANTPMFSGNTSGDCITDLFVSNVNSCSPLHIQNVSSGNVLIGENGGVNVGIGTNTPTSKLEIKGLDSSSSNYGLKVKNSGGTDNFVVRNDGNVGIGTTSPGSSLTIYEDSTSTGTTGFNSMKVITNHPINGTRTPFELYTQNNNGNAQMVIGNTSSVFPDGGYVSLAANFNASINVVGTGFYSGIALTNTQGTSSWSNYGQAIVGWAGLTLSTYAGFAVRTPRSSNNAAPYGGLTGIYIDSNNNAIFGGIYPFSSEKVRILGDKSSSSVFDVSQAYYADSSTISVEDGVGVYSGKTKLTATNSYFTRIYNIGESITLYSIFLPPNYTATTNVTLTITDIINDNILYTDYNPIFSGYSGPSLSAVTYTTGGLSRFHVTNKGNVGIGTNTPTAKLEVKSNSSTGNTIYPFSVNQSNNNKVFYLSNQNYYSSTNNLGVYSDIYDNKFQIDLSGGVPQFKLNYGDSSFQMNPYPALSNTRFLFKTNPSGGGYESGILHIFRGGNGNNGNLLIGEHLQIGTVTGGTGSTIYGKYIQKSNFDNPTTTFYPLVVLDGNSGFGTSSPSETLEIVGKTKTTNLQVTSGASTIGYVLTDSDGTGNVTWSPVSGLTGIINKYSETLTSPSGGTYTITHNLNTTDIQVSLWLVTTGDLTNARITNRQTNSVDVVFSTSPGEDVRVVIIG